jgi:uncharacterized protein (TIGR03067 family)
MNAKLPLCLVILLASFASALGQDDAAKKDLAKMQGVWQVVRGEEDGEPSSDYLLQNLKLTIKGDQLGLTGHDLAAEKASKLTVKIDPSTTPRCIDLMIDAGSLKGDVLEGIYEWQGDGLKLCLHLTRGNRPLEFDTSKGSNRVLFVLKRQAP